MSAKGNILKKPRFWVIILLIVNLFALIGLILSYGAAWISPARNWLFAFFGLLYPVMLGINIVFVFLWLVLWKKYVFLSLVGILIGWHHLISLWPIHFSNSSRSAQSSIRLITYNVHTLFGNDRNTLPGQTGSDVAEFLKMQHGDILCLQEFYADGQEFRSILSYLSKETGLPYYYFRNYYQIWNNRKINAIATFSRYPIVNSGYFVIRDRRTYAIFTDIVPNEGDTIRVYNLHLESVRLGEDDYRFYSEIKEKGLDEKILSEGSKKMFWKMKGAFIRRAQQVNQLTGYREYCPYPVLICGDFNDTPFSYTYRKLTINMKDAFKAAGSGFKNSTYMGRWPAFRIDYVLYDDFFSITEYQRLETNLSDHYPVMVVLSL